MKSLRGRRELFGGWAPFVALVGVFAIGLVALMVWSSRDSAGNCESIPLPEFNLSGVTYTARQASDRVEQADLGDVLGTQTGDVPQGLLRCKDVELKNGQGSLPPGSRVYSIRGVDTSTAIAAQTGLGYMKLYAP